MEEGLLEGRAIIQPTIPRMNQQTEESRNHAVMETLLNNGLGGLPEALRILGNTVMLLERQQALKADPYQRSQERTGYANGFKPKTVATRIGEIEFAIPQTRGVAFYPNFLEKGMRSEQALNLALAEMYVKGVSTRKVNGILDRLCGMQVSSQQVSRCTQELSAQVEAWRCRPLGAYKYLMFDAIYQKVRQNGHVQSCAVLICIGISTDGHREVLGVSAKLSEAEIHWREFFQSLVSRGLHGVEHIVSDAHSGLQAALHAVFPSVPWQRCQFHFMQNALAYCANDADRSQLVGDLRSIFNSQNLPEAKAKLKSVVEKYQGRLPKLSEFLEAHCEECFTVFALPENHRIKMRTSNPLERLNKEIRRRTKVAGIFPTEASLLLLVGALLNEISDDWVSSKLYLSFNPSPNLNSIYRKNVA
jgi:putative transposase